VAVAEQLFVSLDCADPARLGEFWAAMLGGEVMFATPTAVGIRTDWVWLTAIQVSDYRPPSWPAVEIPKQMHFDLGVTDLDAAVAEAEGLGARLAPVQPSPDRWRVLLDPAGHPFCLTTQVPPEAR
jgi:glyoxalase superfamily protein